MRYFAVVFVAFLAVHSASAALKVLPAPWCVCGTAYKLKVDPFAVQWPGVTVNNPLTPDYRLPLTNINIDRPAYALSEMKRSFLDALENPLVAPCSSCSSCYPRKPWPTCGCGCY